MPKTNIAAVKTAGKPAFAQAEPPIDLPHLLRMTLGDHRLACEVLLLFDRQVELLTGRIRASEACGIAALAHTLKGSARGIGAWQVARAAEAIELAAAEPPALAQALAQLDAAVAQARRAIAEISRAP